MDFSEFQKYVDGSKEELYQKTFSENQKNIRVKNEKTAVKNLEKICCAALKISNRKGYHSMTMRDLSRETGLSAGALYAYFSSKEDLLGMLQRQGRALVRKVLEKHVCGKGSAAEKLRTAVRIHLYISEIMQPWFYFSYMETKNLGEKERKTAIESELETEKMFYDILIQGESEKVFFPRNHLLSAAIIKSVLQEWYLKRWKYAKRNISVEQYAEHVIAFIEAYYRVPEHFPGQGMPFTSECCRPSSCSEGRDG